ncbi:MAG: histidine kinase [Flavobacteriales bacterium]|nr:histidine kinase [Flavobacteriales bacterium]
MKRLIRIGAELLKDLFTKCHPDESGGVLDKSVSSKQVSIWGTFVGNDDKSVTWKAVSKQIKKSQNWEGTLCIRGSGGEKIWLSADIQPIHGDHFLLLGFDVSNRVRAERQLRQKDQELNIITKATSLFFLNISLNGRIQFINKTLKHLDAKDVIGKTVYEFFPAKEHKEIKATIKRVSQSGRPSYFEAESIGEGNNPAWYGTHVYPNGIDDHGNKQMLLIAKDITHKVEVDKELEKQERMSKEYQSQFLSTQINPHFIFNAMNAIQVYILDRQTEPALEYVSEFSSLIRNVLENSSKLKITIAEEVEFLIKYLELEKKRFDKRFEYNVIIEPGLDMDAAVIPPMVLQPHVENAVVHGIGKLRGRDDGLITISFNGVKDRLICKIQDNGVGREYALSFTTLNRGKAHRSMGEKITKTRLRLLTETSGAKHDIKVVDLKDANGNAKGTSVELTFPLLSI